MCALVIVGFLGFFKITNRARFRSSEGDVTTEIGYNEECTGSPLSAEEGEEILDPDVPHVNSTGGTNMGAL